MKNILKDLCNALLFRLVRILNEIQLFFQLDLKLLKTYAPNAFSTEKDLKQDERDSYGRLKAITEFLPVKKKLTTLDIGCNLGFFTFNMAKYGGFSIGLDYGRNEILAAKALAQKHQIQNIVFTQIKITPSNCNFLPKTDVVFCLSIYHHWVRRFGEQKAKEIMSGLSKSAIKYFVFDTGQPNEKNVEWSDCLSFIKPNIDIWAKEYFMSLGFKEINKLGEFKTSVSSIPRSLFVARK